MKPKNNSSFFNALFVDFRHIGFVERIEGVIDRLSPSEKIFFWILCIIFVVSSVTIVREVNESFLVEVPGYGGSWSEGLLGSPRFINPVLSISPTDKDLATLVYAGLLKNARETTVVPELAQSYEVSEDGLVYDVVLRDGLFFHDGKPLTSDDVIFTIEKTLDPVIKSPERASWEGIVVEKVSDKELRFILKKPFSDFKKTLTLGILPKHIWQSVTPEEFPFSQLNLDPIGAGPYRIKSIKRNSGGIPTSITLESFKKYALGRAKIDTLSLYFFQNEIEMWNAFKDASVESVAGLSSTLGEEARSMGKSVSPTTLPRIFGVFFNQNIAPVFLNKEVRNALDLAAPKQKIITEVLHSFGSALGSAIPGESVERELSDEESLGKAREILADAGWKANADSILEKKTKSGTTLLAFSISTSDNQELTQTAEILRQTWQSLGAAVDVKVFSASDLNQNVIRPRKYDALLFGEVVQSESDLYAFWHSSQRNDPGLNIAMYANITADKLLEDMQRESELSSLEAKRDLLLQEIEKDIPAVFLFSPNFIYIPAPQIKNISLDRVATQSERWTDVSNWFIETDKVWKFFAPTN